MNIETVDTDNYPAGHVVMPFPGATAERKMTGFDSREELEYTKPVYKLNINAWNEYDLVYKSGRDLIDYALYQHPRESDVNYTARIRDGYVFNFGRAIINIFSFYLNDKEVVRELPGLKDDKQFKMFLKDCDLYGTDYNVFINEIQKYASAIGAVGILVNKPGDITRNNTTLSDEIRNGIYPYYASYSLPNILDWQWERNPITHRRELDFLKLRESDYTYTIWRKTLWERWQLDEKTKKPIKFDEGVNPLDEIPFTWMPNLRNMDIPEIGYSDLVDIGPIVLSIAQNLSCGEEMIKLAGFPIMREPMEQDLLDMESGMSDEVAIGPRAVKDFNPEFGGDAKPDWMPTEIYEPVQAALMWIDRKIDEIFRIAHLSGIHAQRKSNNKVSSGLAMRYELTQLNSVLMDKAKYQTEAELNSFKFWLKWQNKEKMFEQIEIKRKREFSTDELAVALDNAITSMGHVASKTFRILTQQKIANATLPDLTQKDKVTINTEIETNTPDKIDLDFSSGKTSTRNAVQAFADHSNDDDPNKSGND